MFAKINPSWHNQPLKSGSCFFINFQRGFWVWTFTNRPVRLRESTWRWASSPAAHWMPATAGIVKNWPHRSTTKMSPIHGGFKWSGWRYPQMVIEASDRPRDTNLYWPVQILICPLEGHISLAASKNRKISSDCGTLFIDCGNICNMCTLFHTFELCEFVRATVHITKPPPVFCGTSWSAARVAKDGPKAPSYTSIGRSIDLGPQALQQWSKLIGIL